MNEIVKIITTLLFLVCPGGGISSPLAYSGVAHNGGGLLVVVGVVWTPPLVGDSHTVNRNKGRKWKEWVVCMCCKNQPHEGYVTIGWLILGNERSVLFFGSVTVIFFSRVPGSSTA